ALALDLQRQIAVELAEEGAAIFLCPIGQMGDKGFHLLAGSFAQGLGAAEINGIGLDQVGIEAMVPNQVAEAVAELWAAIIPISVYGLRRDLSRIRCRGLRRSGRSEFFERADADAISLAQGTVHGAGLGDPHFGAPDQFGDGEWVCISIPDKSLALQRC